MIMQILYQIGLVTICIHINDCIRRNNAAMAGKEGKLVKGRAWKCGHSFVE
jgi:hypothetical protein